MQYPWLDAPFHTLTDCYVNQKLPHALLITGNHGVGKQTLAQQFTQFLLCLSPNNHACGQCKSCQLFIANSHPDFQIIAKEGASNTIKIDAIRQLNDFINRTAHQSHNKVIFIESSHHLNIAASNALLKTLEEPASDTYLLLTSSHPDQLLATIKSRCQCFHIQPDLKMATQWLSTTLNLSNNKSKALLALAHQSPLLAQTLGSQNGLTERDLILTHLCKQTEPITFASLLEKAPIMTTLNWLMTICIDLIKINLGADNSRLTHQDKLPQTQALAQTKTVEFLYDFLDKCQELKDIYQRKINLNTLLSIESLLIYWAHD